MKYALAMALCLTAVPADAFFDATGRQYATQVEPPVTRLQCIGCHHLITVPAKPPPIPKHQKRLE